MKGLVLVLVLTTCVAWTGVNADTNEGVAQASAQAELVLPPHPADAALHRVWPEALMPPTAVFSQSYVIDPFTRPYMGLQIRDVGAQLAAFFGVEGGILVESVDTNGPAYRSEITAGDVIVSFNGEDVGSTDDLFRKLDDLGAGDAIALGIVRRGASHSRTLTLVDRPPAPERFSVPREIENAVGQVNVVFGDGGGHDISRMIESIRQSMPSARVQAEEMRRIMAEEIRKEVSRFHQELDEVRQEVRSVLLSPDKPPAK